MTKPVHSAHTSTSRQRAVRSGYGDMFQYKSDLPAGGRTKTPLLQSLVASSIALGMILFLGGCGGPGDIIEPGLSSVSDPSAMPGEKPVLEETPGQARVINIHVQPDEQSVVVGQITNPNCNTVRTDPDDPTARVAQHMDEQERMWFKLDEGWIMNLDFCQ